MFSCESEKEKHWFGERVFSFFCRAPPHIFAFGLYVKKNKGEQYRGDKGLMASPPVLVLSFSLLLVFFYSLKGVRDDMGLIFLQS